MKQETLEEVAEKSFGEIWATLTEEQSKYLKPYINRQIENAKKWQMERSYSEEEVLEILVKAMKDVKVKQLTFFDGGSEYPIYSNLSKWFEQFKKK